MRIVSGTHKGRQIHPPKNLPVRPTTDFAKESLFNILNNLVEFDELKVLDLFCGTGGITYEFASRGSADITSVDGNYNCCAFVKKTIADFKMSQVKVIKADAFAFLAKQFNAYSLIFADPPYDLDENKFNTIPQLVFSNKLLKPNGWLIVEHSERTNFLSHPRFKEHRKYGNVNFSFFFNSTEVLDVAKDN